MLRHDEAQVKKYNSFGFTVAKLSFAAAKRFATMKEKIRCNEEKNENKMKPRVHCREDVRYREDVH